MRRGVLIFGLALAVLTSRASAQTGAPSPDPRGTGTPASPPAYGPPISLADARRVVAAAQAEAAKRKVAATLAVVDPYGETVLIERATGAQYAAVDIAVLKARSTVRYRRDTQVFADQIKAGNLLSIMLPGATGMGGGGVLLVSGAKIVGAIGETGGADVEVAEAGAAVLK